jgi:non-ribosomal peptide synthetase component F
MEEYDWVNIIPVLVGGCLSVRQQHMTNISTAISELPPEQRAIRDKCFHPTGRFIEFKREEIEQSIPDRFEQMVRMYPDRLAVKTRSHIFTYNDLNKAANRIAQAILAKRGETQEPTALLFEDDAPVIAAILGVLKTGKMYVPLDPSYPKARISSILDDSQAGLLITDNKNFKLAAELTEDTLQIINVDELDVGISNENPKLVLSPNTLASLFYTSGSTGQPKGVVKNHRNLLHIVMLYTNNFHIHSEHQQTLLFSNSFGPSGKNTFGSLLNGAATVRFNTREQALSDLPDWLIEQNITVYYSSVSVFRNFVSNLTGGKAFPSLRLIHLGGDRLSRSEIDLYKKHFSPECFLVNVLALTETGLTPLDWTD